VFTIGRIKRSQSTGLGVHDQTESVFTIHRSTHPWHYVPVLARKPGALRNGAPFKEWVERVAKSDNASKIRLVAATLAIAISECPLGQNRSAIRCIAR
jgi:hypothetical protein